MLRILCLLSALLLGGCFSESPPNDAERALLVTGADFGYPAEEWPGEYEKVTTYWTRSVDLSYDLNLAPQLFLHSTVSLMPSAGEAVMNSYSALQGAGFGVGMMDEEVTQEELPLSDGLGSYATLILLRRSGEPIGNLFSASVGKKVLFVVFTGGHYYSSAAEFERFIEPKLAALREHQYDDPIVSWGKGLFAEDDEQAADD